MSVYYKEKPSYLKEAISSILNQSLKPSEIVLIKDGKLTEELEAVIDDFANCNPNLFKIISFDNNMGLGMALQEGVLNCSYDIIARMDTDDIAKPDRFEKQIKIFKENPEIDIVGSYIDEFDENINNIISRRIVPVNDSEIKKFAKRRNPFNHMTVMYRKKSVLEAGNYKPFLWNEDYYLWVRMILKGCKMYNIPESLVFARTGTNMFERRGGIKYIRPELNLQKEFLDLGFINTYEYITNVIFRSTVRLIPNKARGLVYTKLLRA